MDEIEQLSHLIGDIYDAAIDPALWPSVQQKTCEFVRAHASTLYWQNSVRKTGNSYAQTGIQPGYRELYFEKFIRINPLNPGILVSGIEEVRSVVDVMPHEEYRQTRFYKEWMRPQGLLDGAFCNLEKSATSGIVFTLIRQESDGLVDDEMRRRMQLIIPHVRRAAIIGNVIDLHKFEAAAFADSLDGLASAVFLVDAGGHIVHANAAAQVMFDKGTLIRAAAGKFAAVDAQAHHALHDIFANVENDGGTASTKGFAVPLLARDGERFVAHVLPLTSGARRKAGVAYSAVAAVFVCKAALELPHPLEAIAATFKLTPAEMRVLMMIVQVGGVPDVAPVLGISEPTVKTHLQHIFDKTGAKRQADLVKLVAGYMGPLAA